MAIQLRRGLEADLIAGNLLVAEIGYGIDSKRLVIGDGEGGANLIPTEVQMKEFIATNAPVRLVYAVSPTSGATVAIAITDAALVQQSGLRVAIMPSAANTASANYTLAINGATAYPIVKPSGSITDYIKALKANTVYELVLTSVGGSMRWVCINYRDDLDALSGFKIARGSVSIAPTAANTPTNAAITFPAGLFTSAPTVCATAATGVPGTQVTGVSTLDVTTAGATIVATRTNTVPFTVSWIAMGV